MSHATVHSLEAQILDFKDEKSEIVKRRMEIDAELSSITAEIRGNKQIPSSIFKRYLARQAELKRESAAILPRVQDLNRKIDRLSIMKEQVKADERVAKKEGPTSSDADLGRNAQIRLALRDLHKKYSEFAADATRVASMRRMASEFCIDLQSLIQNSGA